MEKGFKKSLQHKVNPQEAIEKHNELQEQVLKERKEALEIIKPIAEELKKEKNRVTKGELLKRLWDEDYKAYQKYSTAIIVLYEMGEIPGVEKQSVK